MIFLIKIWIPDKNDKTIFWWFEADLRGKYHNFKYFVFYGRFFKIQFQIYKKETNKTIRK